MRATQPCCDFNHKKRLLHLTPLNHYLLLLLAADRKIKAEVVESHTFDGKTSDAVRLISSKGSSSIFYFDAESGLIVATEQTIFNKNRGVDEVVTEHFLDWREGKDHPISYRHETSIDGKAYSAIQWEVVKESFVVNQTLFEKPKLISPSVRPFIKSFTASAKQDQDRLFLFCSMGKKPLISSYFLLDTGAALSSTNSNKIDNFNAWYDEKEKITEGENTVIQGIGGLTDAAFIKIPNLRILSTGNSKGIEPVFDELIGLTGPTGRFKNALGFNALAHFQVTFDFPKSKVTFSPLSAKLPKGNVIPLELTSQGIPYINIKVGDQNFSAWLDTGASGTSAPPRLVSKLPITVKGKDIMVGVDGNERLVTIGIIKEIEIAGYHLKDSPIHYEPPSTGQEFSDADSAFFRLGCDSIKNFVVTLNYEKGVAVFSKPKK